MLTQPPAHTDPLGKKNSQFLNLTANTIKGSALEYLYKKWTFIGCGTASNSHSGTLEVISNIYINC